MEGAVKQFRGAARALAAAALAFGIAFALGAPWAEEAWADGADVTISTEAEWNAFAQAVNGGESYEGKTVELAKDLDFASEDAPEFTVAGTTEEAAFKGTFEGGFHTIALDLTGTEDDEFVAVFGNIGGAAAVRDFKVAGSVSSAGPHVAGAVAFADGTASISRVSNSATVRGDSEHGYAAGILARTYAGEGVTITGCANKGDITSVNYAGGIMACSDGELSSAKAPTVTSCYNIGAVGSTGYYSAASGIVGESSWGSYSHATKIYNSLDAGDYTTSFYHSYFSAFSPYIKVSKAQANYYKTPVAGNYVCQSSSGRPANYIGVTAGQLAGKAKLDDGRKLTAAMNTAVAKAAGIEWLSGKQLGQDVPCFDWEYDRAAGAPVVTEHPEVADNAHGVASMSGVALAVSARLPQAGEAGADGTLSYQWYEAANIEAPNPATDDKVAGATAALLAETPKTGGAGERGFYCVVTNTFGEPAATAEARSDVAVVTYLATEVQVPTINAEPATIDDAKTQLDDDVAFDVTASVSDGGALSYEWQVEVEDADGEDLEWQAIDPATNLAEEPNRFVPVNYGLGEHTFRCVITNTRDGFTSEVAESEPATVYYEEVEVANVVDLAKVREAVNAGKFDNGGALLTGDIDLSGAGSWQPIGTAEHPFTGTLSAAKHVTISNMTIDDAGEDAGNVALIGYAKGATLANFTVTGSVKTSGLNAAGVLAVNLAGPQTKIVAVGNEASVATTSGVDYSAGIGGLVGANLTDRDVAAEGLRIEKSYNRGALSSSTRARNFGGLVGYSPAALSLFESYNAGSITTGGGHDANGKVSYSDFDTNIGGLVGENPMSYYDKAGLEIKRCYNSGVLTFFYNYTEYSDSFGYKSAYGSMYGGVVGSTTARKLNFAGVYYLGTDDAFMWNCSESGTPSPKGIGETDYEPSAAPSSMTAPADMRSNMGPAFTTSQPARANKGFPRLTWEEPYEAPAYTVKFDVKGTDGEAVVNPEVSVTRGGEAVAGTGADNVFSLTEDVEYAYTVSAGEGYGTAEGTVVPTPEDARLEGGVLTVPVELTKYRDVTFNVTDSASGGAVEGADIAVTAADGEAVAGEDGTFKVVHGAKYSYAVTKEGYDDAAGTFTAGTDPDKIDVALVAGKFTITFAATDSNGKEIEGFTTVVKLQGEEVAGSGNVFKLEQGKSYTYTVSATGRQSVSGSVTPTKAATVTVSLPGEGTVLTVVNQDGAAKEYTEAELKAFNQSTSTQNQVDLQVQYASKNGYGVKVAKKTDYVTLETLLANTKINNVDTFWKHGYRLRIYTTEGEYTKLGDNATYDKISAMKWFYPLASSDDQNNTEGGSDSSPFSLAWKYYEASCPAGIPAGSAAADALKNDPVSGMRVLAGAWMENGKVQAAGNRFPDGVVKIAVERYDTDLLEVVNEKGVSTTFTLGDLQHLAATNERETKMQYAGKNGGTVKVAEKGDYATLASILSAADATWGPGYELSIFDASGTIYAPGDKWGDTTYEYVSNMKWFYPDARTTYLTQSNAQEVPMAIAWTTHTASWSDTTTAQAAAEMAKRAPARDEFRLIAGGWYDSALGMQVPGWRSVQDITKIEVNAVDYANTDKSKLRAAISQAKQELSSTAISEDGSDVANGVLYASKSAHDALSAAIASAQTTADAATVTQGQIDGSTAALTAAIETFQDAKKEGAVDLSGLKASIAAATSAKKGVTKSAKGADVTWDKKWVASAVYAALDAAIDAGEKVVANTSALQSEVDAAKASLDEATGAFTAGTKAGAKAVAVKSLKASVKDQTYTGSAIKPALNSLSFGGKTLKKNTDYTVAYGANKAVGAGTATVKAKSKLLSGSVTVTFKINPKGTAVKSVTSGKKQVTVTWTKQATQTTGYQLRYATKANFSDAKTVTVNKATTVKKAITGLKAKTKYYVQIRTYKTVGKATYYSAWSASKAPAKLTTASASSVRAASVRL